MEIGNRFFRFAAISILLFEAVSSAQITPREMIKKMGRGTNLGNTLEAPDEGGWNAPAKEFYFDDFVEAGFKSVRIPVRWDNHMQAEYPFKVDSSWLARVEEVADWALRRGMVTIINSHHDRWLFDDFSGNLERFDSLWAQIADYFKDKPENLLFEIINEPYFDLSRAQIDTLNRKILPVIRRKNPTRIILMTGGGNDTVPKLTNYRIIYHFNVPDDPYIIGYFHYYVPFSFTHDPVPGDTWGSAADKAVVDHDFNEVKNFADTSGVPFLLGEFGVDYDADRASLLKWYGYISEAAVNRGFAFSVWDVGQSGNKFTYFRHRGYWDEEQLNCITGQEPFGDLPAVPDTLEAENFDTGGNTFAYFSLDTVNAFGYYRAGEYVDIDSVDGSNFAVKFSNSEWTEYSFYTDTSGDYEVELFVSSIISGNRIQARFNKANYSKNFEIPVSGDYHSFISVRDTLPLDKGYQVMRLYSSTGGVMADKIVFSKLEDGEIPDNILSNGDFEDGTVDWEERNCVFEVVTDTVQHGSKAVLVSGRNQPWGGPSQIITEQILEHGQGSYIVSAYYRAVTGYDTAKIQIRLTYGSTKTYLQVFGHIDSLGWALVSDTLELRWNGNLDEVRFSLMTRDNHSISYYVDNASIVLDSIFTAVPEGDALFVPRTISLEQNYPNPFNPSTTIRYTLPAAGNVKLAVYNVSGERVAVLLNSRQIAGTHTVLFKAANLSSGIYFYRLTSGKLSVVRKMVLLK